MMFNWWSDERIGLSPEEYRILKNFTCDLDPENFNVYTDLYMAEMAIWEKPTSKYRSHVAMMIGDLYDLAKTISLTMKNDVIIEPPFPKRYVNDMLKELKETLEIRHMESTFHKVNCKSVIATFVTVIFWLAYCSSYLTSTKF